MSSVLRLARAALLTAIVAPQARSQSRTTGDAIRRYLQVSTTAGRFRGVVLVMHRDTVIFQGAFGYADEEHRVSNTLDSRIQIGSVTKQFTGAAILRLRAQRRLSFGDLACKYLEGCPPAWAAVTLDQLLHHTSGILNFTALPIYDVLRLTPAFWDSAAPAIRAAPLQFAPGSRFQYSNTNYLLLAQIVERITGLAFPDFLRDSVLRPLGMTHTDFASTRAIVPDRSIGYTDVRGPLENADRVDLSALGAGGGLYSTLADLIKWDRALSSDALLSAEDRASMFTPRAGNYGIGWFIQRRGKRVQQVQAGNTPGFATTYLRYPDEGVSICVLANLDSSPTGPIADDLAAIMFGDPYEMPTVYTEITLSRESRHEYYGTYRSVRDSAWIAVVRPRYEQVGFQFGRAEGAFQYILRATQKDSFHARVFTEFDVAFQRDAAGRVVGFTYIAGSRRETFLKVE